MSDKADTILTDLESPSKRFRFIVTEVIAGAAANIPVAPEASVVPEAPMTALTSTGPVEPIDTWYIPIYLGAMIQVPPATEPLLAPAVPPAVPPAVAPAVGIATTETAPAVASSTISTDADNDWILLDLADGGQAVPLFASAMESKVGTIPEFAAAPVFPDGSELPRADSGVMSSSSGAEWIGVDPNIFDFYKVGDAAGRPNVVVP